MATASGTLSAVGDVVAVSPSTDTTVTFALSGTFDLAHVVFEGTTDGTTFNPLPLVFDKNDVPAHGATIYGGPDRTSFYADITGQSITSARVKLQQAPGSGSITVALATNAYPSRPSDTTLIPGGVKQVVYSRASAASGTSSGNSGAINVGNYDQLLLAIDISSGTFSFTFGLDYLGGDGVWYNLYTSAGQVNSAADLIQSFGVGLDVTKMFGNIVRIVWTRTSGNVTFSASLIGRKSK